MSRDSGRSMYTWFLAELLYAARQRGIEINHRKVMDAVDNGELVPFVRRPRMMFHQVEASLWLARLGGHL